jgi:hypothetical protein
MESGFWSVTGEFLGSAWVFSGCESGILGVLLAGAKMGFRGVFFAPRPSRKLGHARRFLQRVVEKWIRVPGLVGTDFEVG